MCPCDEPLIKHHSRLKATFAGLFGWPDGAVSLCEEN